MLDEQQTFRGRIMSVEAVAVRVAFEDPQAADPLSIVDRSPSATEALVLDTGHAGIANADEQASHAIETEQSRSSITQETAVWTGEVKAPTPEEALRSLLPRDNGRLRVGIIGAILIGAAAIAWWAGVLDALRFLNSGPASPRLQQIALPERAPIQTDNQTMPKITDAQTPSARSNERGSKAGDGELSAHTDEDVTRAHPVEPQKTTVPKPAVGKGEKTNP